MTNIKKLDLSFIRLKEDDISEHNANHFPEKGNTSVETLKIRLSSTGRIQSLTKPQWKSFGGMFANLNHLTIESADFSQDPVFLKIILGQMTHLRTLRLRKCVLKADNLLSLCEFISSETSKLEELVIDFDKLITGPVMEKNMILMLGANTSLRSLWMTRSVKQAIDVTLPLLQAIGRHPNLSEVTIENAKLVCTTEAQLEQLKETMVGMAVAPSKLKSMTFEPLSTNL